jgi:tetratricopeptide (TPR) repeat protein
MEKQASIKYLSGLMDNPSSLTEGDQGSIAGYRQAYPYFVPARYLEAAAKHRDASFAPAMMSSIMPYAGDWMQLCDFLNSVNSVVAVSATQTAAMAEEELAVAEIVVAEIVHVPDAVAAEVLTEDVTADAVTEDMAEDIETQHNSFWIQEETETEIADAEDQAEAVDINDEESAEEPVADKEEVTEEEEEEEEVAKETTAGGADEQTVTEEEPGRMQKDEKPLISPVYTEDYFLQQGEKISVELPTEISSLKPVENKATIAKSLMVMMSFSEWLLHFKNTAEKQIEETKDQKALKTMWQKEKLAAAIEEENEEIPENVFEMAVNSITKEDGLASESLAEIYIKQGKYDKAMDMYRKLSLRNPQKNAYFALKIEEILKEKQS